MDLTFSLRCAKVDLTGMEARKARPGDWLAIDALSHRAYRTSPRFWSWEENLTSDSFFVVEHDGDVVGALLAWPDESPVAWMRLAVLDNALHVREWLQLVLPPVLEALCRLGTETLAWMDYGGWASSCLETQGFRRFADVVTLAKLDRALPDLPIIRASSRIALDADIPAIAAIDRASFSPHWWHSEATMRRRAATSSHRAVVAFAGEVVGYASGELRLPAAHLNRIAVHPAHQGRGIGALLLRDALCAFWRCGVERVTLNTQADNLGSKRLYRRFSFEPTGDSVTAWELRLQR